MRINTKAAVALTLLMGLSAPVAADTAAVAPVDVQGVQELGWWAQNNRGRDSFWAKPEAGAPVVLGEVRELEYRSSGTFRRGTWGYR